MLRTRLKYCHKNTSTSSRLFGHSLIPTELSGHTNLANLIFNIYKILAGVEGIEPSSAVLETDILPLNYTPKSLYKIIDISLEKYLNIIWWAFRDLNPGPTGYEPGALTN